MPTTAASAPAASTAATSSAEAMPPAPSTGSVDRGPHLADEVGEWSLGRDVVGGQGPGVAAGGARLDGERVDAGRVGLPGLVGRGHGLHEQAPGGPERRQRTRRRGSRT